MSMPAGCKFFCIVFNWSIEEKNPNIATTQISAYNHFFNCVAMVRGVVTAVSVVSSVRSV
jgi:hypothetical protein